MKTEKQFGSPDATLTANAVPHELSGVASGANPKISGRRVKQQMRDAFAGAKGAALCSLRAWHSFDRRAVAAGCIHCGAAWGAS